MAMEIFAERQRHEIYTSTADSPVDQAERIEYSHGEVVTSGFRAHRSSA